MKVTCRQGSCAVCVAVKDTHTCAAVCSCSGQMKCVAASCISTPPSSRERHEPRRSHDCHEPMPARNDVTAPHACCPPSQTRTKTTPL